MLQTILENRSSLLNRRDLLLSDTGKINHAIGRVLLDVKLDSPMTFG